MDCFLKKTQILNVDFTLNLRDVFFFHLFFSRLICFCRFFLIKFTNVKHTLIINLIKTV